MVLEVIKNRFVFGRIGNPQSIKVISYLIPLVSHKHKKSYLFLISVAIKMKACSTFVAFLAEVSRKGMPRVSANSYITEPHQPLNNNKQNNKHKHKHKPKQTNKQKKRHTLAVLKSTTFLETKSLLLPTRSLFTFSQA
jgi:hypothetical protein